MVSESIRNRLIKNWQRTLDDVSQAAARTGRSASAVRIIGVSKYVDAETTIALRAVGCEDLGESRPQLLLEKVAAFESPAEDETRPVCWHMIGNLQRNKAKRVVEVADVIHSIDSVRLLVAVGEYATQSGRTPKVFIEVNISGESDKHGFGEKQLMDVWPEVMRVSTVPVVGLMGMAGLEAKGDDARRQFAALRSLRDKITAKHGTCLPELSMGMSGDFEEAIREGSTMVRIGSRLFEGVLPGRS